MRSCALPRIPHMYVVRLVPLVALAVAAHTAWADNRQDARQAVSLLHDSGYARQMSDEVRSVDATWSLAERHYQNHDRELADLYYLLALQKARVLLARVPPPLSGEAGNRQPDDAPEAPEPPARHETLPPGPSGMEASDVAGPAQATPHEPPGALTEQQSAPAQDGAWWHDDIKSAKIVGSVNAYTVVPGDTLRLVAAKLGVSRQHLRTMNRLEANAPLKIGQRLKYNNRKIIPRTLREGIVVNIPDRTLYYFRRGKLVTSLPVAVGTGKKSDRFDWKTPVGKFRVTGKQKDPTWHIPPSIRSEMEEEGKEALASIPPGPGNPLGRYAIKTSIPGILIHSTINPSSIYGFASHGCIRVSPLQMEDFFNAVRINTPGEIIYKPVKVAVTEQGRVLLEVHRDVYQKGIQPDVEARNLIRKFQMTGRVNRAKMEAVIRQRSGIAEDISL